MRGGAGGREQRPSSRSSYDGGGSSWGGDRSAPGRDDDRGGYRGYPGDSGRSGSSGYGAGRGRGGRGEWDDGRERSYGDDGGRPGGRRLGSRARGRAEAEGRPSWRRGDTGGGHSRQRQDAPGDGRQPWQRRGGSDTSGWRDRLGPSASRDRYRDRYAARLGAGRGTGTGTGGRYTGPGGSSGPVSDRWSLAALSARARGGRGGGPGGGGRIRRRGDWWRHWTWKKALTTLAAAGGGIMMLVAGGVGMAYAQTPIPDVQTAALKMASTVYFSDGKTVVGSFQGVNRQLLTYNQIPPLVRNAVVAAEDRNFWHEGGVSPTGILRAAYYDLTSSGGSLQGGSTITQQLVRNYYDNIGTAQTMSRKIKEIFVAQKLAQVKSKAWILTQYLNTVYFGDNAYGIGAAAQAYFGVPVSKLTVPQAAMLASMIQSPGYYDPHPSGGAAYKSLIFRYQYVLDAMAKMGTLPAAQAAADKAKFPKVVKTVNNTLGGYRGFIMQAVQYELENTYHYTLPQIENDGLRIVTTFKKNLMDSLYADVHHNEILMHQSAPPTPPYMPRVASTGLPKYVRLGAMLIQPGTGDILAMYSGANYNKNQYDNALQSRNQVGSSFKPYVLATAVKQGMNVMTSKLNGYAPLWIPPDSSPTTFATLRKPASPAGWFQVANDEVSNPNRPVSVTEATAMSLNTSFTDLWHRVALNSQTGQHSVVDMAQQFGVDPKASGLVRMRDEAGTALGQASLTVEEQANMIATLANNGVWSSPHVIKEIKNSLTGTVTQAKVSHREVLTPDQAAEVDYAMSFDDTSMGTANGLGLTNGQKIIAKTGTTNLAQSAFFLGATPRYAMAVGMFVNHPGCTLPASQQYLCTSTSALSYAPPHGLETLFGVGALPGYGGGWPTIIWHDFFMQHYDNLPVENWPALPSNYGTAWNLVGIKPKPKPTPSPGFTPGCQGHGRKCWPSPTPTLPLPSPTSTCPQAPLPCASPTTTTPAPTAGAVPGTAGMKAGSVVAGGLIVGGLATGGLAAGVLPGRRRRRPRGQTGDPGR